MAPSQRWFPTSLAERSAWFNNFSAQFAVLAVHLGFTPAEVTAVADDNAAFQFAFTEGEKADGYADAARQYRRILTEGKIGEKTPVFPTPPTVGPLPSADTGIFERLDDLVRRIRVAPNYTADDGALLGIIGTTPDPISPDAMQPVMKAKALPANVVEVEFVRGKTDGIALQMQLDNETEWSNAGSFFKSPAMLNIPTGMNGVPRAVRLRARYLQGNAQIGQNSDTVNVTTIP